MSRVLTPSLSRLGTAEVSDRASQLDLARLRPLWRYAVFVVALFTVSAFHVYVGLGAKQVRADLDRIAGTHDEARLLNDRLDVEIATRSRAVRMEEVAAHLEMTPGTPVLHIQRGNSR